MGTIVAAVRFDPNVPHVIRAALWLAHARGAKLRLAHVFTPVTPSAMSEYATVRARLDRMAAAYGRTGVDVSVETLIGDYPDALIEHAEEVQASLIVVGPHNGSNGFLGSALRPVVALLSRASVPVLVLPPGRPQADRRPRPVCILLADDLTDGAAPVIEEAADFIARIGMPVNLVHLHVEAFPALGFALSPEYQLDVWPSVTMRERVLSEHHEELKRRLHRRAKPLTRALARTDGRYRAELWHGAVSEELVRAAAQLGVDISIFGRHHTVHRRPLALGQMPFGAMLKMPSAVLVTPHA